MKYCSSFCQIQPAISKHDSETIAINPRLNNTSNTTIRENAGQGIREKRATDIENDGFHELLRILQLGGATQPSFDSTAQELSTEHC